jgi:hypothetical protein
LFNRKEAQKSAWSVIVWWEARRIFYNLILGVTGILTIAVCFGSAAIGEHYIGIPIGLPGSPLFALFGIAAFVIMANVCYTGGWIAELVARKIWKDQADNFGKIVFFLGLSFSVLLTLVPSVIVIGSLIIQLILGETA